MVTSNAKRCGDCASPNAAETGIVFSWMTSHTFDSDLPAGATTVAEMSVRASFGVRQGLSISIGPVPSGVSRSP